MRTIHTEIGVLAPAAVVWRLLIDFEGWARWNPFLRVKGEPHLDERLEVTITPPGKTPVKMNPRIVRLDEGRELRWLGRALVPGIFDGEHGFRIAAEDAGRCRFEQFECFSGILAPLIVSRVGKATETGFVAMNRSLKREAERLAREQS